MTPDDLAAGAKLAYWDLNKAAYQVGRAGYKSAQNLGMRYQNWRHKGAGDENGTALAAAAGVPAATSAKPSKKSWTSDEESFSNTTYSETTYTRKRTR